MFTEREQNQKRFSVERLNKPDIGTMAELYAEVFATPPWNEYTRCGECFKFFGLETRPGTNCPNCQRELRLAYSKDETTAYIEKEIAKPNSVCVVIKENSLNSFAWGFSYQSPEELAEAKYRTEKGRTKIAALLGESGIKESLFYFSECGVKKTNEG